MPVEAEAREGTEKGRHIEERKFLFSGYRVRELNSRVGTLYLMVLKVRRSGYIPFFLTESTRSEVALMRLYQMAIAPEDKTAG